MSELVEIIRAIDTAWKSKDELTMRKHLHEDYSFKGPMMEMVGVDACIACMNTMPFEGDSNSSEIICEGNKAVHAFDWIINAPFQATVPMVEIMEFEDNKLKNSRMFFDTALFPAEFMEQLKQMKEQAV